MAFAAPPSPASAHDGLSDAAAALCARIVDRADASAVLRVAMDEFGHGLALVSSFGTESAVLLALAAEIDRAFPVIFLETGKLFPETIAYQEMLVDRLGLKDVRLVRPAPAAVAMQDADGQLWRQNADRCCTLRKTVPLQAALNGFSAWVTGRKRFQATSRRTVEVFEAEASGRVKVNPLAHWTPEQIDAAFEDRDLPRHPLEAYGFMSIGCTTCTKPVALGEDRRAGQSDVNAAFRLRLPEPPPSAA
jgi:phosphoadenosine phosphosulfate reductase